MTVLDDVAKETNDHIAELERALVELSDAYTRVQEQLSTMTARKTALRAVIDKEK